MPNRFRLWAQIACTAISVSSLGFAAVAHAFLHRRDTPWFLICGVQGVGWTILLTVAGNRFDRATRALLKGKDLLAHWTFEAEEWQRFKASQHRHELQWFVRAILVLAAFSVVISAAWALMTWRTAGDLLSARFGQTCLAVGGYVGLFVGPPFICFRSIHRTQTSIPGIVMVGRSAYWVDGVYWTWADKEDSHFLRKVEFVKGDPSELQVCFDVITRRRTERLTVKIPVPRRHEAEAKELLPTLREGVWTNEDMPW